MSRSRRVALAPEDLPILLAVVFLPWAFGGATMWAVRFAGFFLSAGAAIALARHGTAGLASPRGWLLPAVLLGAFAFAQTIPLPPAIVAALSPGAAKVYEQAFPGWPATTEALPTLEQAALEALPDDLPPPARGDPGRVVATPPVRWSSWRPLSLSPAATLESAFWYLALLLATFTVVARAEDRGARSAYRDLLFVLFALLAGFGLLQATTWNGKIYWFSLQPGRPFGPYLNGSHFAGAMEIACPWIAGYVAMRVRRDGWVAWRSGRGWAACTALLLCAVAGLAAQSKMGAVLIGLSLTVVLVGASRAGRWRRAAAVVALGGWLVGAAIVAAGPLGARFRSEWVESGGLLDRDRLAAWSSCLPMWTDFPWVGSGFGAFRDVFPRYLAAGETQGWLQAHNDWLEVALAGGLVGVVLLVALVVGFGRRAFVALHDLNHRGERTERRGLLLGLASLAVHAVVDFNHQIPANALLFVVGAAIAAAPAGPNTAGSPR